MASTRIVIGLVVTAASAVLALVACSGSTTTTGTGDGGGASSGASGASGASGGTSGTSGSTSGIKTCPPSTASTCTDAELKAYGDCFTDKCNTEFTKCYGPDYKNGNFSGPCGTYLTCTQACACGDTACLQKCTATSECTTCLGSFATCSSQCKAPACASGSSGSSGTSGSSGGTSGGAAKTCADLAACCAKITVAATKTQCLQTYDAVKTSEASCNAAYAGYASSCP